MEEYLFHLLYHESQFVIYNYVMITNWLNFEFFMICLMHLLLNFNLWRWSFMFSNIHSIFYASFVIMCSVITRSGSYLTNEWVVYSNVEHMFSWHNHYQCHHHSIWKIKRKKKEHTRIYKKQEAQYKKNSYWIISKQK